MQCTNYVVGFMFDSRFNNVALIKKSKPEWQRGLLNGIGGKIEDLETPAQAMMREFEEETGHGTYVENWKNFCSMGGVNNDLSGFNVEFFYTVGQLSELESKEEEKIVIVDAGGVCSGSFRTIGNVPWLVALALDFAKGVHPPSEVRVNYRPRVVDFENE